MSEQELLAITLICAILGGALGARIAKTEPWRGALLVFLSGAITAAVLFFLQVQNQWIVLLCQIVTASVIGGMLRLGARQIASILIGAILLSVIAGAVLQSV